MDAQGKKTVRMFVLEPADTEDEFDFYGFSVAGKYRVVEKVNGAGNVGERWNGFRP